MEAGVGRLHAMWLDLCTRAGVAAPLCVSWWETVLRRYTEPQRHYHTMTHLEELVALYDRLKPLGVFADPDAVAWTIYFHDIIYDPQRPDNEANSAREWDRFVAEVKSVAPEAAMRNAKQTLWVSQTILQTANHMACPLTADQDTRLFLDMDVAILGAAHERYVQYAEQIRLEYQHMPRSAFCEGRAAILRRFAQDEHLFKTELLSTQLLETARDNLGWEITQLECPPASLEPLYFADRAEALAFESDNRRDRLRLSELQLNHALCMNTGHLCAAYRHRDTKQLLATVVATLVELSEDGEARLAAAMKDYRPPVPQPLPAAATTDAAESHDSSVEGRASSPESTLPPTLRALVEHDGYSVEYRDMHAVHGTHLMIHSVCVTRRLRRRGLASKLLRDYIDLVLKEGPLIRRITIVAPDIMVRSLSHLGFHDAGPRPMSAYVPVPPAATASTEPGGGDEAPGRLRRRSSSVSFPIGGRASTPPSPSSAEAGHPNSGSVARAPPPRRPFALSADTPLHEFTRLIVVE